MTANQQGDRTRRRRSALRARVAYQRLKQFFALPGCYRKIRAFKDCKKSRLGLARDLLVLFFSYKTFPDNYGLCRLWEVDRKDWKYYYGSNYHPHQRSRLLTSVKQHEYRIVFIDKFLFAAYCQAMGIRTPFTYGIIDPAEDYRDQVRAWFQASSAQTMIIKPLCGRGGSGIVLAGKINDDILIRSEKTSTPLDDYVLAGRSIVQKVLLQDARMAAFSPYSVNTLRIVTMLTRQRNVIIMGASMRSGVAKSFVDNWSAGGVAVGIDSETGKLKKYGYDRNWKRYESHPTTGVVFENYMIPEWDRICSAAAKIQKAFLFYRILGLDIAIEQSGEPVLIEINGAPDFVAQEQWCGPLLKSELVLRAFGEYNLLVNKHQRKLYVSLDELSSRG